jgi:hypothetical protein
MVIELEEILERPTELREESAKPFPVEDKI